MKIVLASILFLASVFFFYSYPLPTPCDNSIEYRLGSIDSRFNVSEEAFLANIAKAEAGWESEYGKDLFKFSPDAKLKVSLIYDERQYFTSQIGQEKTELDEKESNLKPNLEDFKRRGEAFKRRTEEFNKQVEYWNSQGGAPQEEFDKLLKEKDELQVEASSLNVMAKSLNQSTQEYNQKVDKVNQDISAYNQVIGKKPEGGIYDPKTDSIDIFYNASESELVHTIAHELGHALGLGHINDPNALMYPQTNATMLPSPVDIAELTLLCTSKKPYQLVQRNIKMLFSQAF